MNQGPEGEVPASQDEYDETKLVNILARSMEEFISQVEGISKDFDAINKIAMAAKSSIEDPSKIGGHKYLTYSGQFLGNYLIKPLAVTTISQEEHIKMFGDAQANNIAAFTFLKELQPLLKNLSARDLGQVEQALKRFVEIMEATISNYMEAIQNAPAIQSVFLGLTESQRKLLDGIAKSSSKVKLSTDRGIVAHPFQHLGRIPLMLEQIAKNAQKIDVPAFKELGAKLESKSKEAKTQLAEINKALPKPQFKRL